MYLLFAGTQRRAVFALADLFLRVDLLAGVSAMLAARAWIARLGLSFFVLGLTLLVGRVWCGWVCSLGTVLEWLSLAGARARSSALSPRWRRIKHGLLLLTLTAAAWMSLADGSLLRGRAAVYLPNLGPDVIWLQNTQVPRSESRSAS